MNKKVPIDAIVWDERLYPRTVVDWKTAHVYADSMRAGAKFPPIEVVVRGEQYIGLDGRHRWTAAKRVGATEIEVHIVADSTEKELFMAAVRANLKHGRQFSTQEKLRVAARLKEDYGMSLLHVGRFLQIPKKSLLSLLERRLAPLGAVGNWTPPRQETPEGVAVDDRSVVLKAPLQHLAGSDLPSDIPHAQHIYAVGSQKHLLSQVLALANADAFDLNDIEIRTRLNELHLWLAANEQRIAA